MSGNDRPCAIKMLVVIVNRSQESKVLHIVREERIRFHCVCLAEGTAGSEFVSILGLSSIDKSCVLCLVPDYRIGAVLTRISEKLQLRKPGKGIAFVSPLTGLNNAVLQMILKDMEIDRMEEGENLDTTKSVSKYDLIVAVVNQGHVDEVMSAARAAGARGGTVLHGRKVDIDEDAKFFGITAQLEKDIVAILTVAEQKHEIMSSITQACGLSKEARGMIFSLPVDEIEGLGSVKVAEQAQE